MTGNAAATPDRKPKWWANLDRDAYHPKCDRCDAFARWSVGNFEGDAGMPTIRWMACGRHLHRVLEDADWHLDAVELYDLSGVR